MHARCGTDTRRCAQSPQLGQSGVELFVAGPAVGQVPKEAITASVSCKSLGKTRREERPLAEPSPETGAKHRQSRPEVAAVDAGDVTRFGRLERGVSYQLKKCPRYRWSRNRVCRVRRAAPSNSGSKVSKIMGGQAGQQAHADIGGAVRCAIANCGICLHVVRRQPMIFRADPLLEIVPGLPGPTAEVPRLVLGERRLSGRARPRDPPGDPWSGQPGSQHGGGRQQDPGGQHAENHRRQRGNRGAGPHEREVAAAALRQTGFGVAGRGPLK